MHDTQTLGVDEKAGERLARDKARVVEALQGSADHGEILQAGEVLARARASMLLPRGLPSRDV